MKHTMLKRPVISEKTLTLAKTENAYTFVVSPRANKNQIKEAIELAYGVHVTAIRTVKIAGRTKRTGKKRMPVSVQARKKAVIVLKEGEKIAAFDVQG